MDDVEGIEMIEVISEKTESSSLYLCVPSICLVIVSSLSLFIEDPSFF